MIKITTMLSLVKIRQHALCLLMLAGSTYAQGQISGLSSVTVNQTATYTYNNGYFLLMPSWQATKGQVLSTSQTGSAYSVVVKWTSSGAGAIKLYIGNGSTLKSTKNVTVNVVLPSTPNTPTSTKNCGSTTLHRATPPTGVTWYWQGTNSNGTSTSTSGANYSISSNGTYYLRARNNTTNQWSASSSYILGGVIQNPSKPSTPSITKNCASTILTKGTAASGTTSYWQTSSSGTSTSNSSNTKTVTSPGTYYIRSRRNTAPYCWSSIRSFSVTINSLPSTPSVPTVSNHSGYSTITRGTPSSGTTWYWQTSSSGSSTSNSNSTYTATLVGTYNIYLRSRNNSTGCWSQNLRAVTVTVSLPPNMPSTPTSTKSCGSTTLHRGTPPSGVTWYWQGTNSNGTSTSTSGSNYSISSYGTYYLRARNNSTGLWSTSSSSILGLVVYNPSTPSTPSIANNCGNSVLTKGSSPAGQNWYWQTSSGGTSTGNSSNTYTVTNSGTYYLRSRRTTSPYCWSTARSVSVNVNGVPATPSVPVATNNCASTTITRGTPPSWNKWYWQTSSNGTSTSSYASTYTTGTPGTYYLRARSNSGCWSQLSSSVVITVTMPPSAPEAPIVNSTHCGSTVITRSSPPPGKTWYWQSTSSGTSTATSTANPNKTVTTDGTYYLRARDNSTLCWSLASSIVVDVNENPAGISWPTTDADRFGQGELTLTAGLPLTSGNEYHWYTSENGGSVVNVGRTYTSFLSSTTAFYIAIADANTGCESTLRAPVTGTIYAYPQIMVQGSVLIQNSASIGFGSGTTLTSSEVYDSYAWVKDNEAISTAQQIYVSEPGDYTLAVTKGNLTYTTPNLFSVVYNDNIAKVNYIKTQSVLTSGITTDEDVYNLSQTDQVTSLAYTDGLNRPIQSIATDGAGSGIDIVQNYSYDEFGRSAKSVLPHTSANYPLGYLDPAASETDQQTYYDNSDFSITDKAYPYAETKYDNSPLHRVEEVGAPGADWQLGSGHTVRTDFGFNEANEVRKWTPAGLSTSTYGAKELMVNTITDENDHIVRTYTDSRGLIILKQVEEGTNSYLNTYSVYDDLGRLKYTIPPKAVEVMSSSSWDISSSTVEELVFSYQYDARGRLVEKKVSGAESEYIIYDQYDRVVLTQDGNLRNDNKWGFVKYDYRDRAVYTGIYTNTTETTRIAVQGLLDALDYDNGDEPHEKEEVSATYHGYSSNAFPTSNTEILAVSYYDHYDFDRNGSADYSYNNAHLAGQAATNFTRIKGRATGSKTRILGSNNWLTNVVFYDKKGRTIQSISNNHKNLELSDVTTVVYDFSGKLLKSKTITNDGTDAATTVNNEYGYDAQGRVVDIWHQTDRDQYDVTWKDMVGASIADNTITKTASSSWSNAGATSINELAAGEDGWVEMTVLENSTSRMFGLAVPNSDPHYASIDFALYPRSSGLLRVYEKGVYKGEFGTYSAGDKLKVERTGSTIYYSRNGVVFYTSTVGSSGALVADISLYHVGSTVANIKASFGVRNDVAWVDANGVVVVQNTLIKTAGDGWGNAGAASLNKIKDGDNGGIQVTAEGDFRVIVGLSEINTNDHYNTIDYCILMANNYVLLAYENGSNIGNLGTYVVGDIIEVKRINGQIHYKKNGVTLQVSTVPSTGSLIGDVALHYTGDRVSNAKMTTTPKILVAHYEYSDLGQLVKKNIHKTADNEYLQTVDYDYNIRGWLKSINDPANITADQLFGMELLYNESMTELGQQAAFNGNISAMKWKEQYGNGVANDTKAYSYAYDNMDRLTSTQYGEGAGFVTKSGQYALQNVGYDANGNMEALERKGLNPATGFIEKIDDLAYTFDGNRMSNVDDTGLAIGYDQQSTGSTTEYTYDDNGNMLSDDNKDITSITYNVLNKPEVVTFGNGTVITYTYNAAGSKLSQQVNVGGVTTTTDYLGDKLYVNNQLQSLAQPEGRIVYNDGNFAYQYAYTDHLGNVRMLYTSEETVTTFTATMESESANQMDDALFQNITPTPDLDAVSYDEVARLNSAAPVGPGLGLPVYPGDQVSMSVKAYHRGGNDFDNSINTDVLIGAISAAFGGSSSATTGSEAQQNTFNTFNNVSGSITHPSTDPNRPAAYLNYILFDKYGSMAQHGYQQISAAGSLETLAINDVTVQQEGFVYVYLSNESNSLNEVYFDDMSITLTESLIIQNTSYYPFGLQHANSWTRPTDLKNNFLYNAGAELNEQTKNYETFYRDYDPALGRFNQIDPLASSFSSWNPYQYAFNDPVALNDPMGLEPERGGYDHYLNDVYMENDRFRSLKASDSNPHMGADGGRFSVGSNWSNGLAFGGWSGGGQNFGSSITSLYNSTFGGTWSASGGTSYFSSTNQAIAAGYSHHVQVGNFSALTHSGVANAGRTLEQYNVDGQYIQKGADGTIYVPYTNVEISALELVNGSYTQAGIGNGILNATDGFNTKLALFLAATGTYIDYTLTGASRTSGQAWGRAAKTFEHIGGYVKVAGRYVNTQTLSKVGNYAGKIGRASGVFGLTITAARYGTGEIGGIEAGLDAGFGVLGLIPNPVTIGLSLVYFGGKIALEATDHDYWNYSYNPMAGFHKSSK